MEQDVGNTKSVKNRKQSKKWLFAGCTVLGVALLGVVIFLARIYFFSDASSDRHLTQREDSVNTENEVESFAELKDRLQIIWQEAADSEVATASPTPEPTASPTPEPTASPTPEPTASPTPEPTASPTPEPTASPTPEPTASPTPEPTASPTPEPTASPTPEPTPEPTASPTPEPTEAPTMTPEPTKMITPTPDVLPESTVGEGESSFLYSVVEQGTVCLDRVADSAVTEVTIPGYIGENKVVQAGAGIFSECVSLTTIRLREDVDPETDLLPNLIIGALSCMRLKEIYLPGSYEKYMEGLPLNQVRGITVATEGDSIVIRLQTSLLFLAPQLMEVMQNYR